MFEKIRVDILQILNKLPVLIKEKNYIVIKELSNHTLHNASIYQDEDSISIAVMIYALSKLLERIGIKEKGLERNKILNKLKNAAKFLNQNNFKLYNKNIKEVFKIIESLDTKLKIYIQEIVEKSKIKKGSRIYEHGISLARAASIMGISQWELMNYIGKTSFDVSSKEMRRTKQRLEFTRRLFAL